MNRLKDKVAIVTGSTSGIGKGIAKMFAAEGARVVVCGRREERGAAIVDEIQSAGGEAMYHFLDVTKPETVDALLADTEAAWGKIDVMVNNAAGMALKSAGYACSWPCRTSSICPARPSRWRAAWVCARNCCSHSSSHMQKGLCQRHSPFCV